MDRLCVRVHAWRRGAGLVLVYVALVDGGRGERVQRAVGRWRE